MHGRNIVNVLVLKIIKLALLIIKRYIFRSIEKLINKLYC